MIKINAIIFDMNGVIIDDEKIHEQAFRSVVKEFNYDLTSQDYKDIFQGKTDKAGFLAFMKKIHVHDFDLQMLKQKKIAEYFKLIDNQIESIPGVAELIHKVSKEYKLALVSSANSQEVEVILVKLNLKEYFLLVVSGDDVQKGKPDPQPYIMALRKLGEKPENCIVIEDTSTGIKSAKAAGVFCIAITTTHEKKDLIEADKIVDNYDQVREILRKTEKI